MARPGITYQDVVMAAETLQAQQRVPTIENIRHILGTGSHSTIANHFRSWKMKLSEPFPLISQALPESLIATMTGLWMQVSEEASSKIESIKKQMELEAAEVAGQLSAVGEALKDLQIKNSDLGLEKECLLQQKLTLEQAIINLQRDLVQIAAKVEGLQLQIQVKDHRHFELQDLNRQAQHNLEHYRESSRQQRILELERFEQDRVQFQQTLDKMEKNVTLLQQDKLKLMQELVYQNKCNAGLIHEKAIADRSVNQLQQNLQDVTEDKASLLKKQILLEEQYQTSVVLNNTQNNELIKSQKDNGYLNEHMSAFKDQIAELKNDNQLLQLEKNLLLQDKARLEGQLLQFQKPSQETAT